MKPMYIGIFSRIGTVLYWHFTFACRTVQQCQRRLHFKETNPYGTCGPFNVQIGYVCTEEHFPVKK
jgi:disulfide bond formation protein DsbB